MTSTARYGIDRPYTIVAKHTGFISSNRVHANGLTKKLGFRGGFVLGIAIYGYMTRALVERLGEKWLARVVVEVKFLKPVCEGDRLRIETMPVAGREAENQFNVTAYNESMGNEVSALLTAGVPVPFPEVDAKAGIPPNQWSGPVAQLRTWDSVVIDRAYRTLSHTLTIEDNRTWQSILSDDLPVYTQGEHPPIHPAHVLRQAQLGTNHECITDNAVHCSTRAVIREMLRVGDSVQLLTVPIAKWEKKQNHWITMYCAIRREDQVCAEIYHTQIFKLRGTEEIPNTGR